MAFRAASNRPRSRRGAAEAATFGAVAQLGERLICNQEVVGSIPISSTKPYEAPWGGRIRGL